MAEGKFISYLRVSTAKQGRSGLGLEAQRESILQYLNGGGWQLLAEHVEVETGKHDDRPQLQAALDDCRRRGATLLIAKLDRLSRDAHFLIGLQKSNVNFVAVDLPQANPFTIGVMALVAQQEREAISARTKAALAAAKARGQKLGKPENLTQVARLTGAAQASKARTAKADDFAARIRPLVTECLQELGTLTAVAQRLNADGVLTARGKTGSWTARAVKNLLER